MDEPTLSTRRFFKRHQLLIVILLVLVLLVGGIAFYYYNQYQASQSLLKNPNIAVEKQTKQLVDEVGKLIVLPKDEQPTVATVTDASKLKDQPFFKNARNGDKVLIYVNAKKAILYDPSKKVIVEVAPVNLSQQQAPTSPTGGASPTVTYVQPTAVITPAPTK